MALLRATRFTRSAVEVQNIFHQITRCCHVKVAAVLHKTQLGTTVTVQGWVKSKRKMKTMSFIDISDGSSPYRLQITSATTLPQDVDVGASVKVTGVVQKVGNKDQIELVANDVQLLGTCKQDDGYPFIPRRTHSMGHLRQHLHLRPRTNFFSSLLRVRSQAAKAIRDHFDGEGFIEVNTPVLTSCDCEGAGEVFSVVPQSDKLLQEMSQGNTKMDEVFFGTRAFLTVSGQMHLEAAARALGHVYTLGPTFRAENSKSRLHLSEFYMLEAESVLERESIEVVAVTIERMLKHVTENVLNKSLADLDAIRKAQIQFLKSDEKVIEYQVDPVDPEEIHRTFLSNEPYKIMSYQEAFGILRDSRECHKSMPVHEEGLTKEQELWLVKRNGGKPIFVIDWPRHLKAFYMKDRGDGLTVAALDLLVPVVGELCGGSVRESCLDTLVTKLKNGNQSEKLTWYKDLRMYGNVSTGGFGMGFERYLQTLLNIPNIKDVIPFPRWPHNCQM